MTGSRKRSLCLIRVRATACGTRLSEGHTDPGQICPSFSKGGRDSGYHALLGQSQSYISDYGLGYVPLASPVLPIPPSCTRNYYFEAFCKGVETQQWQNNSYSESTTHVHLTPTFGVGSHSYSSRAMPCLGWRKRNFGVYTRHGYYQFNPKRLAFFPTR